MRSPWDVWRLFNSILNAETIMHWKLVRATPQCIVFEADKREFKSWSLVRNIELRTGNVSASLYNDRVLQIQFEQQPIVGNQHFQSYRVLDRNGSVLAAGKAKVEGKDILGNFSASEAKAIVELLPPFMKR